MKIKKYRLVVTPVLMLLMWMFVVPVALSAEMTPSSLVYDDATYTAEMEKDHQKLHMLYAKAFDKSIPLAERTKARRDFFDVAQKLNKTLHSHVMSLNVKAGDALSHTDTLLATHLLLMTTDMLSTMQQEVWENDPGMKSSD